MTRKLFALIVLSLFLVGQAHSLRADAPQTAPPPLQLTFDLVERRAFDYFYQQTDPRTGLTKDRATDLGDSPDTHTVASIAATGYALAALPIGVEHGWISRDGAYRRAVTTLRFLRDRLPQNHGFGHHFVDWHSGTRVWKSELSSCDTALLLLGALTAGDYWPGTEADHIAHALADRADWRWLQNEGGATPQATAPAMGWTPENGWLPARWQGYSEAAYVYWLGLGGSAAHRLSPAAYDAWKFPVASANGRVTFGEPSPLFMAQMASGFFDVRGLRDRQGRDWWSAWTQAHCDDRAYCAAHSTNRTYAPGYWGLTATDTPDGYGAAVPADGRSDGTVSPSAMLASLPFTPDAARDALRLLWQRRDSLWGRYGFVDAFNLERGWTDRDVIGIDLGMMLLAIENARSGLIWRLLRDDAVVRRGLGAAGFGERW